MAWTELFSTDVGLLSLFTIAFVVVMAFYLTGYVRKHMAEDERKAREGQ